MELLRGGHSRAGREADLQRDRQSAKRWSRWRKKKNLRYGINLNHRFTPAALRAKEWVDAGRLGELNIINMTMWINNPNETLALVPHARAAPALAST